MTGTVFVVDGGAVEGGDGGTDPLSNGKAGQLQQDLNEQGVGPRSLFLFSLA